jgi:hypothetical protein
MIFWLVLKLEISYRVIITSWRILVCFRGFFEDYYIIFAWWKYYLSFHNSSSFALRYFFNVNGKAKVCHTPKLFLCGKGGWGTRHMVYLLGCNALIGYIIGEIDKLSGDWTGTLGLIEQKIKLCHFLKNSLLH